MMGGLIKPTLEIGDVLYTSCCIKPTLEIGGCSIIILAAVFSVVVADYKTNTIYGYECFNPIRDGVLIEAENGSPCLPPCCVGIASSYRAAISSPFICSAAICTHRNQQGATSALFVNIINPAS